MKHDVRNCKYTYVNLVYFYTVILLIKKKKAYINLQ